MKISLIVPVFNKQKYIHKCLLSLVRQTHKDIDILVFDDGSTDDSVGIIKRMKSPKITLFGDGKNHGVCYARNRLVEAARTKIVALQDADDFSHPYRIAYQIHCMERYKSPRMRVRKVNKFGFMEAETKWFKDDIRAPEGLGRLWRRGGVFCSEMYLRKPIIPFREDIRVYEERVWISDMNFAWGALATTKQHMYAKRIVTGDDALSTWGRDKEHLKERMYAGRIYRTRRTKRPVYMYRKQKEIQALKPQWDRPEYYR